MELKEGVVVQVVRSKSTFVVDEEDRPMVSEFTVLYLAESSQTKLGPKLLRQA